MAQPKSRKLCFEDNAVAHARGKINVDEYLDNMLAHLTGVRHTQDTPLEQINSDGLSMAIQSCLFEPGFKYLKDVSIIKRLLSNCWNGSLDVEILGPKVLAGLKPFQISNKILLAMICIACMRRDLALLRYCFTLTDENAGFWSATTNAVLYSATANPDPIIWDALLENGWSRPSGQYWEIAGQGLVIKKLPSVQTHQERLASFALVALKDSRRVDLLTVLVTHGLRVSNALLNKAAVSADPVTMKVLLENCDENELVMLDDSKALLVAAGSNGKIIEALLDAGFDVNWKVPIDEKVKEKTKKIQANEKVVREQKQHKEHKEFKEGATADSRTALHVAAAMGNLDAVKLLLKRGARTDIKDSLGRTAEKTALENGRPEIAEFLKLVHAARRR